jgi:hypothetical protein
MRRGLWFVAGAGAGVYTTIRVRRLKEAFTADGLSDRWHALTLGARMLRDEVAQGQAEAESGLRERFGLVPHGAPELAASPPGELRSLVSLRDGPSLASPTPATSPTGARAGEGRS